VCLVCQCLSARRAASDQHRHHHRHFLYPPPSWPGLPTTLLSLSLSSLVISLVQLQRRQNHNFNLNRRSRDRPPENKHVASRTSPFAGRRLLRHTRGVARGHRRGDPVQLPPPRPTEASGQESVRSKRHRPLPGREYGPFTRPSPSSTCFVLERMWHGRRPATSPMSFFFPQCRDRASTWQSNAAHHARRQRLTKHPAANRILDPRRLGNPRSIRLVSELEPGGPILLTGPQPVR
jgi:hypothetical protein